MHAAWMQRPTFAPAPLPFLTAVVFPPPCAAALAAGGFVVPRGQDVMISVYNIHRSPAGEQGRLLHGATAV